MDLLQHHQVHSLLTSTSGLDSRGDIRQVRFHRESDLLEKVTSFKLDSVREATMTMIDTPVLIVGAGPAGASLACFLALGVIFNNVSDPNAPKGPDTAQEETIESKNETQKK